MSPEKLGYSNAGAELVAEGIRAYLARPEYFKSIAPNAASALRRQIRETPKLNKWLHLNSFDADDGGEVLGLGQSTSRRIDKGLDV